MKYSYKTYGTCSKQIDIELEGNKIKDVTFLGGCNGNLKGISALIRGLHIKKVTETLKGITCANKSTSCPDQLARALESIEDK